MACFENRGDPSDRGLVVDHAHGYASAAEAAHDPQPLVVAADDDATGLSGSAGKPVPLAPGRSRRTHIPASTGSAAVRPATDRLSDRLAYQLPETNRMIGPKLRAAGAPRKRRRGTEDSSPGRRTG
jgi:hypothetical protein